jgi:glycosyltransferase involved in cell wall biosynthesis
MVSLVTPFFNVGEVFHETARSVLRQSLQQWEWIIVDDGSDCQASTSILAEYAGRDPRIHVIRSAVRGGPSAARNAGVRAAKAPYIAFIDDNDLFEPTALEKWLWFLDRHPQYAMVKGFQIGFGAEKYLWQGGFHSGAAVLERNVIQTACMIRREIYQNVGGMDESLRGGMEAWEFWLRCANAGHWGGTIPEVLDWHHCTASRADRWQDGDSSSRQQAFRDELRRRYPRLFDNGFPQLQNPYDAPFAEISPAPVFQNRLRKSDSPRLLFIVPHLVLGGADKFNIDLISELTAKHSYEITVATTRRSEHHWRHRFEALTPDVFTLDTFLSLRDFPSFLVYLIRSRQIDTILISHSLLGYQLLPYLRAECPEVRCFDYVHIDEPAWKGGGYPAYSLTYQSFLERTLASSNHIKNWMVKRGGDAEHISVVTTNIDSDQWSRSTFDPEALRRKWDIPEGTPVVLFAARLCDQKQPDVLAQSVLALRDRKISFLCLVAGDGEEAPAMHRFIEQNQLTEMRLLGSRSSEEIQELLAISDIFFLPSRHEGIALALYEAMSMETVVVASNVGGQSELVTPSCGVLIEPGDGQTLRYVNALAALLQDRPRREAMAAEARRRVAAGFRLDDMSRQMAGYFCTSSLYPDFDIRQAMASSASSFAREAIEQRRIEQIADDLWARSLVGSPVPVLSPSWRSNIKKTVLSTLAILLPALGGKTHRRNRRLLYSTLMRPKSRRKLIASFDRTFYRLTNTDVPSFGPLPLLHYVFFGFQEGRRPSREFGEESALTEASDAPSSPGMNPLLWKCLSPVTKPLDHSN